MDKLICDYARTWSKNAYHHDICKDKEVNLDDCFDENAIKELDNSRNYVEICYTSFYDEAKRSIVMTLSRGGDIRPNLDRLENIVKGKYCDRYRKRLENQLEEEFFKTSDSTFKKAYVSYIFSKEPDFKKLDKKFKKDKVVSEIYFEKNLSAFEESSKSKHNSKVWIRAYRIAERMNDENKIKKLFSSAKLADESILEDLKKIIEQYEYDYLKYHFEKEKLEKKYFKHLSETRGLDNELINAYICAKDLKDKTKVNVVENQIKGEIDKKIKRNEEGSCFSFLSDKFFHNELPSGMLSKFDSYVDKTAREHYKTELEISLFASRGLDDNLINAYVFAGKLKDKSKKEMIFKRLRKELDKRKFVECNKFLHKHKSKLSSKDFRKLKKRISIDETLGRKIIKTAPPVGIMTAGLYGYLKAVFYLADKTDLQGTFDSSPWWLQGLIIGSWIGLGTLAYIPVIDVSGEVYQKLDEKLNFK